MTAAPTFRSVRDAVVQVWRDCAMTTMFCNPGSTEIPLLADLSDDIDFVLGLHEASVVGLATGAALARESPQLVVLHTTAGLGNAVGALATARVNRAPLVVVVGGANVDIKARCSAPPTARRPWRRRRSRRST